METDKDVSIEHQNVPEAHRGLHDFLYSSDDEHAVVVTPPELGDYAAGIVPLADWCTHSANAKVAGVYAVLDSDRQTQYVGYSRNVLLALNGHVAQNGKATCAFVRVQPFKYPKRTEMETLRDAWISELGTVPVGNAEASAQWANTVGEVAKAVMSAEERHLYEEKKLKLRKAMADTSLHRESDAEDISAAEQRQKLDAAVNNDDWSAVIDGQTQETK